MNTLSLFYIFSLFLSVSFASATSSFPFSSKKCSRALEEVIYKPETCAFLYMQSIAQKFILRSPIVFGPEEQADAFIYSFENEFGILVDLVDAFGRVTKYSSDGTKSQGAPNKYSNSAQAYLNFPGFVRQPTDSNFFYTFQIFSQDARYYAVTFIMPLENDPIVC